MGFKDWIRHKFGQLAAFLTKMPQMLQGKGSLETYVHFFSFFDNLP